jgi:hypothetical protein
MTIIDGISRFAATQRKAAAWRRTERMLNALPEEVQKDIGWRATGTAPHPFSSIFGWDFPRR